MALKHTVDTLDAVPEPARAFYVEKDGKFVLDAEGVVPESEIVVHKTKLGEFRANNEKLLRELDELRPKLTRYEGIDPDEYKALKADKEKLGKKGVKDADDIEAILKKAIDAAVAPIRTELESEKKARTEAQRLADAARFRELFTADAKKHGVKDKSLRHVLREAEDKFELKDGALAPRNGDERTPAQWLQELAKSDDYLFEPSTGGGAAGNPGGGGKSGARQLINPTPEQMGQHMDAIAKGDLIVVRQ